MSEVNLAAALVCMAFGEKDGKGLVDLDKVWAKLCELDEAATRVCAYELAITLAAYALADNAGNTAKAKEQMRRMVRPAAVK